MTKLAIKLLAHHCNHWPYLTATVNQQVIWTGQVQDQTELMFELEALQPSNRLVLTHHGKSFGENDVWDSDPATQQDCGIEIKDITFEDITIGPNRLSEMIFHTHWSPRQQQDLDAQYRSQYDSFASDGKMFFNGELRLDFDLPILNWLTVFKYKVPLGQKTAYFSAYEQRWHYDRDLEMMAEIRRLMRFNENSDSSRT